MRALTIAWVAMAILTAGALFAGAEEEGSQCSAALRGGADACQATCGAGQTAVCKADGSRVGCFCRDASSEKSGDDHKGHYDGDGEHDGEHDGHGDGGDDDGDREHGEHDGHGDGGDDDGDGEHGGEHDGHGDGGHDHDGRESSDGDDGQPGASGNGADSSED